MQQTVVSAEAEAKQELNELSVTNCSEFRFNINEMAGKSRYRHRELWSLWYGQIFDGITDGVNAFLSAPLPNDDMTAEDSVDTLVEGVSTVLSYAESNLDDDLTPLIEVLNTVTAFREGEQDELTLIIKNTGGTGEIETVDQYIERPGITVDTMSDSVSASEAAALREHRSNFCTDFNDYYNRPTNKYRRELHISLNRTNETVMANLSVTETRVAPPTLLERIARALGLD